MAWLIYSIIINSTYTSFNFFSRPLKTIITREYVDNKIDTTKMIIIIYNLLILLLVPFYAFLFFHSHKIFPDSSWAKLV